MAISTVIQQAADHLRMGKLVAIPTETVYGLAADAANTAAVRKIFSVKGRPESHPLIVHIADERFLEDWAVDVPPIAYELAKHFWPGPLTMILKKAPPVSMVVTGGQETIGLRAPAHPLTQQLLHAFKGGVAAPSANKFGRISPTRAEHVREELGDQVDFILDGGSCQVGIESTILDLSRTAILDEPVILRLGMIAQKDIEAVIKKKVVLFNEHSPRVSGALKTHYAPKTPTVFLEEQELLNALQKELVNRKRVAVIARQKEPTSLIGSVIWKQLPSDPELYANLLYQTLRDLDQLAFDFILIEDVPASPDWAAIRDRLVRATST